MQALHAFDMQCIGTDPGNIGPEHIQHLAKVLDMRLGSRIADDSCPAGGNRSHQDILRGSDGGLIQQDIGAFETFRIEPKSGAGVIYFRTERLERQVMCIQTAAADHIPARRRKVEAPGAGKHGAGQQDGGADAPAQVRVQVGRPDGCAP